MGSLERRERQKQEIRGQILDAARDIMGERGYEGLTMRAVADRIEYTAAAIYKHFADREALVRALCTHDFYGFAQVFVARPTANEVVDALTPLRRMARLYAEFAMKFPQQYRVMFMTPLPPEAESVIERGNPEQDAYASLERAVAIAMEGGHFGSLDAGLVAQTCWATMHGVVSLEIAHLPVKKRHIKFLPLSERVNVAIESVIAGLDLLGAKKLKPKRSR